MKLTRASAVLWMAVLLVCGGVLGALGHRVYSLSTVSASNPLFRGADGRRNPEAFRKRFMEDMSTRLKLNSDQVQKIEAVMDDTREQFRQARTSIDPQMQKIRQQQEARIDQLLSTEQKTEWEKMRQERAQDRKKRGDRPGPPR